jgi:NAD(P)-dependent dehydrogenase (short-subunit alcohol dehydrogenase family)
MKTEITIPPVESLFNFHGKVAVITGGGSGIGAGIVRRFAEAGATVAIHYHTSKDGAERLKQEIILQNGKAEILQADLTNSEQVNYLFGSIMNTFGKVDILINNTGTYPTVNLLEMTPAQWDDVINVNLRSTFLCTQAAARLMIDSGDSGSIINITSIEAENPAPSHCHYDAAKGGMLMLTRSSALELAPHHIRVNAVAPGLIWKEGIEQEWPDGVERWKKTAPLHRLGIPEDVADACLFFASDASRWITGASLLVDGGVMTHCIF